MIEVMIIDDEKKACTNLKNMLAEYVDQHVNVICSANNTREAEKKINQFSPDAIFLDIEMPNENAFQFLDRIAPFDFEIVFVTSYDEYAIRAFKLNAVDYILKPISISELCNAVQKLGERISYKKYKAENLPGYTQLSQSINNKLIPQNIILRSANHIEIVDFVNIYYVEAHGSYSRFVFQKESIVKDIVMSNPLSEYEELLPADAFYRIHKTYLINCSQIEKIIKADTYKVMLKGNFILPVSRRRYLGLITFLKEKPYKL